MRSRLLYAATIFLSSLLLFLVEPIAAKQLLPILGGSSAVWLTCLVFFQIALLLGYLYAHTLARNTSTRLHLITIALAVTASIAAFNTGITADPTHPVRAIFLILSTSIGLPFLLLASTSPLLQVWLAKEGHGIPYRLFALSNVGSLLALFLYPTLIEPNLTLRHQRLLWLAGFLLYAALSARIVTSTTGIVISTRGGTPAAAEKPASLPHLSASEQQPANAHQKLLWFLLPMAAAMQLASVTGHLTENIAAIPLLWMLPLAAYLLSFILAFEFPRLYQRGIVIRLLAVMLAALGYALSHAEASLPVAIGIPFYLAECFIACYFCHAEVYAIRPEALRPANLSQTTLFYLLIAAGGATGTFLIGIACPLLFSANYDLSLAFFFTAVVATAALWRQGWSQRLLWSVASVGLFVLAIMLHVVYTRDALTLTRNFYGSLRVKQTDQAPYRTQPLAADATLTRMMLNGTIQHGTQIFSPALAHTPTTYYAPNSGVGLALTLCCANRARNVGVIGLGAGTLAAYGKAGDLFRFYELNPSVEPIAQNYFTYLRDSPAGNTIINGDGRASLARELLSAPNNFDVLVIDAFSGDAIPLHLLTTQALDLYQKHLASNGIMAFHVSNQYVDLAPEIRLLATHAHLQAVTINSPANDDQGAYRATWILVTKNEAFLAEAAVIRPPTPNPDTNKVRLWTDDYSSLLPLLRFK